MFDILTTKAIEPVRWLLILGLAYTLANTVAVFFATPQTGVVATVAQDSQPQAQPAANVNWILTKHLFGEAGAQPETPSDDGKPAVQTRLPLELNAVWVADEPDASKAIVAQRGKPGQRYAIGDKLPGDATLIEVLDDRIIFRRAGVRETLVFPQWKSQFTSTSQNTPAVPLYTPQPGANDDEYIDEGEADLTTADIADELRDRLANEGEAALADYGLEVADSGGYRLGNITNSPYLKQTGLQAGDVILSVNGQPVGDVQQDQLQIENILAQGTARIEIQRGERRFTITASLPQ